jgi:hypothetical protein
MKYECLIDSWKTRAVERGLKPRSLREGGRPIVCRSSQRRDEEGRRSVKEGDKRRRKRRKTHLDLPNVVLGEENFTRLRTRLPIRLADLEELLDVHFRVEFLSAFLRPAKGGEVSVLRPKMRTGKRGGRTPSLYTVFETTSSPAAVLRSTFVDGFLLSSPMVLYLLIAPLSSSSTSTGY